jgi:hypothetical protein
MLQAERSRIRFPMRSLDFSIDLIFPGALMPLGSTQPLTEMSTRNIYLFRVVYVVEALCYKPEGHGFDSR